ncbi:MAG: AmmeMemoRadiSam system protein B [Nanoarchaeota archaeon]|nr:AmmeMemoRadiSam system protein B [Nanoarchaeota archaeon]MBU1135741.1 AmmeMemoRadiSam system protein B [Nanoarchaeota archaeon]MBU2520162.1 AmmeMemoRadiSam system protein B [Nanoarchaeota archaeon]
MAEKYVRPAIYAGNFYSLNSSELEHQLNDFFSQTKGIEKECRIIVSPHAGYVYSGRTAAYAVSSLKPAKSYIILGPNHTGLGETFAIMPSGGVWDTPLGRVETNKKLAEKLLSSCGLLKEDHEAHMREHSIEVQLPFLQFLNKEFTFVPISIMSECTKEFAARCEELGKTIAKIMKEEDLSLIISSDFSHYLSEKEAEEKDNKAIERIEDLDLYGFFETLQETDASICGYGPIGVAIVVAKELGLHAEIIHRSNSGQVTKDFNKIVSYIAIGFE